MRPLHAQLINTSGTITVDSTGTPGSAPGVNGGGAAQINANGLTVILDANFTGGNGGAGANGGANNGTNGGSGFLSVFNNYNITLNSGKTIRGGDGGNGGNGAASAGGNGGTGSSGVSLGGSNAIWTSYGSVIAGNGGSGGNGNNGVGGNGANGGDGFYTFNSPATMNLYGPLTGGNGGHGGAGNGGNNQGGTAGTGGLGFAVLGNGNTINIYGAVRGGTGGNGGTSVGTANNRDGNAGGVAMFSNATGGTLTLKSGASAIGGDGGAAGTGGSGTAGAQGSGGIGLYVFTGSGLNLVLEEGASLMGGAGSGNGEGINTLVAMGSITNAGTINSGRIGASAINIGGALTTLNNSGIIGANNLTANTLRATGTITNLINSGSILSGSGTSFFSNGITNFENRGTISSDTGSAIVFNTGAIDDTLDNTGGLITSAATGANGTLETNLSLGGKALIGGMLRNTAVNGNAIYSILPTAGIFTLQDLQVIGNIRGTTNVQEYAFTGNTSLDGDMDLGLGANTMLFNGNFTGASHVDFMATGGTLALSVGALGNVVLNGIQEASNNISTFDIASGGRILLNENFSGSGLLTNNGRVELGFDDTLAMGNMAAGGAGNIWSFAVKDQANTGKLAIGGANAVNFTNSQIVVDASAASNALAARTPLLIADGGAAAVLGALDGTKATDNSLLLNFNIHRGDNALVTFTGADATQVFLVVDISAIEPFAETQQSKSVASVLDQIGFEGDDSVDQLQSALIAAGSSSAINTILEQVVPEPDQSIRVTNLNIANDVGNLFMSRMNNVRGENASSDELNSRVWAQGFGRAGDQGARSGIDGFSTRTLGMAVGVDTDKIISQATIGAAVSYGASTVKTKDLTAKKAEIDSYLASVYADYGFTDQTTLTGVLSYGWGRNDTKRQLLGQTVIGDFDTNMVNAHMQLNHRLPSSLPGGPVFVPNISVDYTHFHRESYREKGIGALAFGDSNSDIFSLGTGLNVQWDMMLNNGMRFQPYVSIGYAHDIVQDDSETSARFAGAPGSGAFKIGGGQQTPAAISIGGGFELYAQDNFQFTADYDFEKRADYNSHGGFVRASYRF